MKDIQISRATVKALTIFAAMLVILAFGIVVKAQEAVEVVSNEDFLLLLFRSVGGLKGATTLMIAYTSVEILIQFLKTPLFGSIFKKVDAALKLTIVMALHFIGSTLALVVVDGMTLSAALIHGSTVTAFAVLLNQIYQTHIKDKK